MSAIRTWLAVSLGIVAAVTATAQAPPGAHAPAIPLREGLTIVTAVSDVRGDYESIKRITTIDAKRVKLTYSTDLPPAKDDNPLAAFLGGDCGSQTGTRDATAKTHGSVVRNVRREDLESAHEYRLGFNICSQGEELYPGSTAVGVSSSMMSELNTKGQTRLSVPAAGPAGALANLIGGLLGGASKELGDASMRSGVLTRAERGTVPFNVLVNDEWVQLAAVHAKGRLGDEAAEFWILDDAANPLSLQLSIGDSGRLQVIKLSYPPAAAAAVTAAPARIERDLAKDGRAIVYGIYFDFASDRIKEESEPVLAEIAGVLQHNPTWSLALEGHTDSIGGDAPNLDLSKRRAAAVRQALVARYKIDGKRLQTSGYGASRPKATNDTLAGRARNRRVELVKVG